MTFQYPSLHITPPDVKSSLQQRGFCVTPHKNRDANLSGQNPTYTITVS